MARVLYDGLVEYDDSELNFLLRRTALTPRRNPRDRFPNGQRCHHLPRMVGRARARRAEKDGHAGGLQLPGFR